MSYKVIILIKASLFLQTSPEGKVEDQKFSFIDCKVNWEKSSSQ